MPGKEKRYRHMEPHFDWVLEALNKKAEPKMEKVIEFQMDKIIEAQINKFMEHLRPKLDSEMKERGREKLTKMEEKTGQKM